MWLAAGETAELLRAYGIPIVNSLRATTAAEASAAAEALGVPVAVKLDIPGVVHKTALRGRGIVRDIRPGIALARLRAVDVQFGDVDRQAKRLQFRQRLVFGFKTRRGNADMGLRADGHDRNVSFLE